jgi:TPR repeat protein
MEALLKEQPARIRKPRRKNGKASRDLDLDFPQRPAPKYDAVYWHKRAAEQGLAIGQLRLGELYAKGFEDLPQDYAEAYKWMSLAATQGSPDAVLALAQLSALMTPEQVAEGEMRARRFVRREPDNAIAEYDSKSW